MGYQEDLVKALQRQSDLIKQQVILEMIQIVTNCDTYDEFKKAMYGMAIQYFKDMESEGLIKKGTVEALTKGVETKMNSDPKTTDDMFII